jgi:hypothetical protein
MKNKKSLEITYNTLIIIFLGLIFILVLFILVNKLIFNFIFS